VPSASDDRFVRRGVVVGLKSPGLEEGVLAAVLSSIVIVNVEEQQGEIRHVW
jgi:hypothetical protein